jgi:tRNA splicing endonuclease
MSQSTEILKHLKEGNELNAMLALERFGCMRLAARIRDLRDRGWPIETTIKKGHNGKVYASYRLEGGQ